MVDDVIDPRDTRIKLIQALDMLRHKQEERPKRNMGIFRCSREKRTVGALFAFPYENHVCNFGMRRITIQSAIKAMTNERATKGMVSPNTIMIKVTIRITFCFVVQVVPQVPLLDVVSTT